ncbi:MAG: hypothetical protein KDA35_05575 [Hyphomonadaceae bacterium]|nr:hypothetical protein [Hyphomonadaceae bacterium]
MLANPQSEGSDPREEIDNALGALQSFKRQVGKCLLAEHRRLQECAWRRTDDCLSHAQYWLCALNDRIAVERQAREIERICFSNQFFKLRAAQQIDTTGAFDRDVDPAVGQQTLHGDFAALWQREFS